MRTTRRRSSVRRKRPAAEAQLAALYADAKQLARRLGGPALDRITGAQRRDDAYYGAWLARHAVGFDRMRKA